MSTIQANYYRFQYRRPGESFFSGILNTVATKHSPNGAGKLVDRWNRRDIGKAEWRYEIVLPTDFDHPDEVARIERNEQQRLRRIKARLGKADASIQAQKDLGCVETYIGGNRYEI